MLSLGAGAQELPVDSLREMRDSTRRLSEVVVYARQMLGSKFEATQILAACYVLYQV